MYDFAVFPLAEVGAGIWVAVGVCVIHVRGWDWESISF